MCPEEGGGLPAPDLLPGPVPVVHRDQHRGHRVPRVGAAGVLEPADGVHVVPGPILRLAQILPEADLEQHGLHHVELLVTGGIWVQLTVTAVNLCWREVRPSSHWSKGLCRRG